MSYATGCHTVFHHRYHIVWVTKYRYKVLDRSSLSSCSEIDAMYRERAVA